MNSFSTETRAIRKFGAIGFVFFGALFLLSLWRQGPVLPWFFGILACLCLGCLLLPSQMRPVYTGWMRFSHALGRLTTLLILSMAYYIVITPTGLLKRLFGGRPFPTSPDRSADSYWVTRSEPAQPKERFEKRY
ncbi:MAG: SxtJ family membrane protein [Thermodesulfobacteriota bacterium]